MENVKAVEVTMTRKYRQVNKVCPVCETPFTGSPLRIYCSRKCALRRGWERHGAEYAASRKAKREQAK
jgi:hypothetical protein